jgi:hypothetical protein
MATRIDEVEAAVVALLKAKLAGAGITDIAAITREDFDEEDNIITRVPAARIQFVEEPMKALGDGNYLDYASEQQWIALVGSERASTATAERGSAQEALEEAKNGLAGARLALSSNIEGAVIALVASGLFRMARQGTWYAIHFMVKSFSHFTGNIGTIR